MNRLIATIEGQPIWELDDAVKSVTFVGRLRVDDDGTGSSHGDPFHQTQTSLRVNGQPLNSDIDRYIVVPPQLLRGVKGIVLGCRVLVIYAGMIIEAVAGDVGPEDRLGEGSLALISILGMNPDVNKGGDDNPTVVFIVYPGKPAPRYRLQAS